MCATPGASRGTSRPPGRRCRARRRPTGASSHGRREQDDERAQQVERGEVPPVDRLAYDHPQLPGGAGLAKVKLETGVQVHQEQVERHKLPRSPARRAVMSRNHAASRALVAPCSLPACRVRGSHLPPPFIVSTLFGAVCAGSGLPQAGHRPSPLRSRRMITRSARTVRTLTRYSRARAAAVVAG